MQSAYQEKCSYTMAVRGLLYVDDAPDEMGRIIFVIFTLCTAKSTLLISITVNCNHFRLISSYFHAAYTMIKRNIQ